MYAFLIDAFAVLIISATYLSIIRKVTKADILQQITEVIQAVAAAMNIVCISSLTSPLILCLRFYRNPEAKK